MYAARDKLARLSKQGVCVVVETGGYSWALIGELNGGGREPPLLLVMIPERLSNITLVAFVLPRTSVQQRAKRCS